MTDLPKIRREKLENSAKSRIDPENDEGNKEYKLKLFDASPERVEQLITQMRYRVEEGLGEALYTIGVTDSGGVIGLSEEEFLKTKNILDIASAKSNYVLTLLSEHKVDENKKMYEFLVREKNPIRYVDIRIACAGNVDSGKCEAKNTKIRLYSGKIKNIQDITTKDVLLGDDRTPRKVLETTKGFGQMYKITPSSGEPFIVNKNHILCFKVEFFSDSYTNKISTENVIELSLEKYVNLDNVTQNALKLYRIDDDRNVTIVSIERIDIEPSQEYYGFELDGNGRYLHEDFTVTHNSTLLGVLLSGQHDDGRGTARLNVFNFQHEIKSGRTSSVAQHILGFDSSGRVVNYNDNFGRSKSWPEIVQQSSKIVTFFDLCGHEKYLKTTILGLTSQCPDLVMILVGGNMGLTKMTKEHIILCLSLHIPFIIVITKIDICKDRQKVLEETITETKQFIKAPGIRRVPYDIKSSDDVMTSVRNINSRTTVPFFYISSVTGEGLDYMRGFLNLFNKKTTVETNENKLELHVDQTFHVQGVGTVIGGQLIHGKIKIGDKLIVGPENGQYHTIQVRSIHCKRVTVEEVDSGRYVCLGVKKHEDLVIRRGHVILSPVDKPYQVNEFEAEIAVLKSHSTTIKIGYEPVIHSSSIRQTARIVSITNKQCNRQTDTTDSVLRTGDRAVIRFKFCYKPEYLREGFRALFCEGRVKVIGKITKVVEEVLKIT